MLLSRALARISTLLFLVGVSAAPAQTNAPIPANVLREALIAAAICRPDDECTPTPDKLAQLSERAKATEQWQPVPLSVSPGRDGTPPSDAIILFDGKDLDAWRGTEDHKAARWRNADGLLVPDKLVGNIETKRQFRDYQLHLEWRVPKGITGTGQLRWRRQVRGTPATSSRYWIRGIIRRT